MQLHIQLGVLNQLLINLISGTFIGKLRIEGILFQPIESDNIEFEIPVK